MNTPRSIVAGWGTTLRNVAGRRWTERTVLATAHLASMVGDVVCVLIVLHFAFVRFHENPQDQIVSWLYAGLGASIFVGSFAQAGLYLRELLLDRRKQIVRLLEAWFGTSIVFFGVAQLFVDLRVRLACVAVETIVLLTLLLIWRVLMQRIMRSETVTSLLRQRVVILGWSEGVADLTRQMWEDPIYPCEIIGYVEISLESDHVGAPPTVPCLGSREDLALVLQEYQIDSAFLAGTNTVTDPVLELARICQAEMVEFKVIPSCFPAFSSGVHVECIAGIPILGTDQLRINRLRVRVEKRILDIVGGLVGLFLFGPVIALFGLIVYLESPGPVFYRQRRLGLKGKPFEMIKIRSMRIDAETNGKPGWTVKDDPRRLKIGAFMRRCNIDELPQFWNVLKGDMSLVGPRPERPELIVNLKHEILNYNLRHFVKPGLTGWAQVNGLRGDTDLSERIRHDLFYIDNWSALLDLQTLILTFFKNEKAC